VTGTFDNTVLVGFEYGIDTEDAFALANVPISNSQAWALVSGLGSPDATDDDAGFDDASLFTDSTDNTLDPDPAPFTLDECNELEGPAAAVLDSDTGAFSGGADWLNGTWIDWSEN
jgi:hypothetical protein